MKHCVTFWWENTSSKSRCLSGLLRPLILLTLRMHHRILHFRAPSPFPFLPSSPPNLPLPLTKKRKEEKKKEQKKKSVTPLECHRIVPHLHLSLLLSHSRCPSLFFLTVSLPLVSAQFGCVKPSACVSTAPSCGHGRQRVLGVGDMARDGHLVHRVHQSNWSLAAPSKLARDGFCCARDGIRRKEDSGGLGGGAVKAVAEAAAVKAAEGTVGTATAVEEAAAPDAAEAH